MKWMQFLKKAESIDFEQANTYIDTHNPDSFTLLDVRQPSEYETSHIPGAVLIPLPELLERYGELDDQKPTLVY